MKIKNLSLIVLAAVGLLALSPELRAQPAPGGGAPGGAPGGGRGARGGAMTADQLFARLETALGTTNKLTDVQTPKVKAVFEKLATAMTALRPAAGGATPPTPEERTAMNDKRTAATKEASDALKAILTPDQFKIYEALPAMGGRGQGGGRRGGAGGPGGPGGAAPAPAPAAP